MKAVVEFDTEFLKRAQQAGIKDLVEYINKYLLTISRGNISKVEVINDKNEQIVIIRDQEIQEETGE
jgi:hypothetical protein